MEWYDKLWESAVPIDEELKIELTLAGQKEEVIPVAIEDPNKTLFLSLLTKRINIARCKKYCRRIIFIFNFF